MEREFTLALIRQALELLDLNTLQSLNAANRIAMKILREDPLHIDANIIAANALTSLYVTSPSPRLLSLAEVYRETASRCLGGSKEAKDWETRLAGSLGRIQPVRFLPQRKIRLTIQGHSCALFYDLSSRASFAANYHHVIDASVCSPLVPYGDLPVPGTDVTSDSVEGVWQGLKIIRGSVDYSYFIGEGRKRYGHVQGHKLGNQVVSYVRAREKIFVPSYESMLTRPKPAWVVYEILRLARVGVRQYVFDGGNVSDVHDTSGPMAHAAVFAKYVNEQLGYKNRRRCEKRCD